MRSKIFTIKNLCGILLIVKRLALLTVPLLAAFAVGGITAGAETEYPGEEDFIRTLTFTSLNDYAIEGDIFAFADGNSIKVIDGDNYSKYSSVENLTEDFTAVDIEDGKIFCLNEDKVYYIEQSGNKYTFTQCQHDFKEYPNSPENEDYLYFTNSNGINIINKETLEATTYEGSYSNIKQYGDKFYAIYDNKTLCEFTGTDREELTFKYAAKPDDIKIPIKQTATELKKYSSIQFVEFEEGTYMTEIDLDGNLENLSDECFKALNIKKAGKGTRALVLHKSGDIAIVSIGANAYAVLNPDAHITNTIDYTHENSLDKSVLLRGARIYASPFVSERTASTSTLTITVTVINKIENDILEQAFYEVKYMNGDEEMHGYVAEGLLGEYIPEDSKDPTLNIDPNYSEKSDTKKIIIIFVVIVLVLAALAYIALISNKGLKKDKKKKEEKKPEEK